MYRRAGTFGTSRQQLRLGQNHFSTPGQRRSPQSGVCVCERERERERMYVFYCLKCHHRESGQQLPAVGKAERKAQVHVQKNRAKQTQDEQAVARVWITPWERERVFNYRVDIPPQLLVGQGRAMEVACQLVGGRVLEGEGWDRDRHLAEGEVKVQGKESEVELV